MTGAASMAPRIEMVTTVLRTFNDLPPQWHWFWRAAFRKSPKENLGRLYDTRRNRAIEKQRNSNCQARNRAIEKQRNSNCQARKLRCNHRETNGMLSLIEFFPCQSTISVRD